MTRPILETLFFGWDLFVESKVEHFLQLLRNRLVATAHQSMNQNSSLGQLYGHMQETYQQMQTPLIYQEQSARVRKALLSIIHVHLKSLLPHCFKLYISHPGTEGAQGLNNPIGFQPWKH